MKRDIEDYARMDDDHEDRNYPWLRSRVDKAIAIKRAAADRRVYEKGLQGGKGSGAAGAELSKAEKAKKKLETCRMYRDNGKCKFGAKCHFAHASAERPPKGPKTPAPPPTHTAPAPWVAPPVIDPALAAKGKGKGKGTKKLRKAAVAAAAESVAADAALAAAIAAGAPATVGGPQKAHRICWNFDKPGGCERGDKCNFAHGPPGTLTPAEKAAAKGGGKSKG